MTAHSLVGKVRRVHRMKGANCVGVMQMIGCNMRVLNSGC